MKSILSNPILLLIMRMGLGGLFVISSLDKLADPQAFANSVLQYKIAGPALAMGTATILPPLEFLCGLCLVLGFFPRGSELLFTVMLVGFTILVASALVRGLDISCGDRKSVV